MHAVVAFGARMRAHGDRPCDCSGLRTMRRYVHLILLAVAVSLFMPGCPAIAAEIGIVLMHGKGGMPNGLVKPLAEYLEGQGFRVANLEMPWSKNRTYGSSPEDGAAEIDRAFADMKAAGIEKHFLIGHSLGGLFAAYYAGQRPLTGLILVAPGGDVASRFWQKKTASSRGKAERMIADGKGDDADDFDDFEGSKGSFSIRTTAKLYLAWFSEDSPLNQVRSYDRLPVGLPVLNVVPTDDYKGLLKVKDERFSQIPETPFKEMFEPETDHKRAPDVAAEKIADWMRKVAGN